MSAIGDWNEQACVDPMLSIAIHEGWSRRWSHAGRLADYVATYFATYLRDVGARMQAEGGAFLAYAVNELVENAVKFGHGGQIEISANVVGDELVLHVASGAPSDTASRYLRVVEEIAAGDPLLLFMERVERNASEGPSSGSGLGLLTMMTDYGARLGWRFEGLDEEFCRVQTMARWPLADST
ncbi:MAG: hypothetical protein KDI37_04360 [Xanthomonadales bacterium]|nr:hypothetical protein [Xanthomonadales bacterium]MCB1627974.1 hypothetical protein [Xanthomonadales bacterium]MCB1640943.1 hypothetical protein [Xanthomonadales bacterium]